MLKMKIQEKPLTIFGEVQVNALEQIKSCMKDDRAVAGAIMADGHLGYSMPIGGVVAYEDAVSPTGVGFDIACGNKCVRTNMHITDIYDPAEPGSTFDQALQPIMREIQRKIEFGVGRANAAPIEHPVFENPIWPEIHKHFGAGQELYQKARAQLGTVGSGNHYVDLLLDDEGFIWVANHFGSRGLGHTIASGFFAKHAGLDFTDRVKETEGAVVFSTKSDLGQFYIEAMTLAGEYAYAGRDYVIDQVLGILGAEATFSVHNHHNFAWEEDGLWVVRKGATPLTTEPAFIGGSMGDSSVIVRGRPHTSFPASVPVEDLGNLGSAPHGAGRVMSRNQAAGKVRKMWYCNNRNCTFVPERSTGDNSEYEKNRCPLCALPLRKGRIRDTSDAKIDWDAVRADLKQRGIVVLGAGADEAPGVYKSLADVIGAHPNIEILHKLDPIGVVMAGPDERDPYRD